MRAGGFPGNPGGLVVSILKTAGARAPAHQARGRGRRTWRPTERTAGARMVPPGEGNEARGDGRRGVGVSHSTAEAGELSPRDPVEGRGHRQVAPLEGKTANTPRLGPVSTSRQRIAELARQALGMAVAIAWLPGPAGTRRRVAKLSVEEPDAAEPARPDLWGARVSNDPGLPDHGHLDHSVSDGRDTEGPPPAIGFWDVSPQDRRRTIRACAQCHGELTQHALDAILLDGCQRLTINARSAAVTLHPLPRRPEEVSPPDTVHQGVETALRGPLGGGPQSTLQLAYFDGGPRPPGGVGTGHAGHALTRPCAVDMTTAGALPSCRVLPHGALQYYGPL